MRESISARPNGGSSPSPTRRAGDDAGSTDDLRVGVDATGATAATDGFLGVPVGTRSQMSGSLYLTGAADARFTTEDESLLVALATTAGVAIENSRLHEEAGRRQDWLLASAEVNGLLLAPEGDRDPLQLIVDHVLRLAEADVVTLVSPSGADLLEVGAAAGAGGDELRGLRYAAKDTLVALAMDTGHGVRVGTFDEKQGYAVHLSRAVDVGAVLAVPVPGRSGPQGAIMAGRLRGRRSFTTDDLDLVEAFAEHAAVAREVVAGRRHQEQIAVLEDRDRIARDLHDHVLQRLMSAGISVQRTASIADSHVVTARLTKIAGDLDDTIRQVRTSIFQLRSSDTAGAGLRAAVITVSHEVAPMLGFEPSVRVGGPTEIVAHEGVLTDIEAVVREALTNVARHAHASSVTIQVTADAQILSVDVSDDGVGFDDSGPRSGLENLRHRAEDLGGELRIASNEEQGSRLTWTIPLPS